MSKELIEQLAKEHGKPKKSIMRPNPMGQQMLLDGYDFTPSELEAFAKAYQAAAPIDNGMPSDTEMMFNQMQFGADMVTKYSNACKEVKRLSELHTAIRESIIRIIDGNYVVPQEVRGEIYCIKNITGEALFPDTQAKKGE
jgi:hypothetical protein